MANRRMISRNISTSRKVNRLSDRATLLYTWMIPHTDDYGHLEGDPLSIRAKIVPMRKNTESEIADDLDKIEENGLITRYEIKGEKYLEITAFDDFQTFRKDRPKVALYPFPDGSYPADNQRQPGDIPEGVIVRHKRREVKLREDKVSKDKGRASQYLNQIPEKDMKEFLTRFVATEKEIKSKSEDLLLYCQRKGKTYSNYKAFLLNALKRDFKERSGKDGKYTHL